VLALAGASFALYAGTLRNGFVIDDRLEVLQDRLIRKFANIPSLFIHNVWYFSGDKVNNHYRPLETLLYAIEYHLFRFDPVGWHFANVLFNIAAIMAVYFLARDLAVSSGAAAPVARPLLAARLSVPATGAATLACAPSETWPGRRDRTSPRGL
jgi:hypothetical protein